MSSSKAFLAIAAVVFLILSASAAPAAEPGEKLETSASSYYGFGYPYLGGGYPYFGSGYSLGYPYSYSYGHYGGYPRSYGYGLHGGYW